MNFRYKVLMIITFCIIVSLGSFFMIRLMSQSLENQLLEKCRIEVLVGAAIMSDIIGLLIEETPLTTQDVFDFDYKLLPGSNPPRYHTRYNSVFDRHIQRIQDEFLRDKDLIYAVLMDKNGYVPTHNSKYSHPPTGDYNFDLMYSRSKRIFSGSESIRRILSYTGEDVRKVLYKRDTGETIWNMGAPVYIKDQHWGSFIIGVSLERLDEIKNQMILLTMAIMFVILSLTMLAILAVIPRKMLPQDLD